MNDLTISRIYQGGVVWLVGYEDGHGSIELLSRAFSTKQRAERYAEQNQWKYTPLHVIPASPSPQSSSGEATKVTKSARGPSLATSRARGI
jgi:hypothetical protein